MAGGKETPRQKMIGMMYLVLTALLALNVTKEVVNAFVTINDKLDASAMIIENKVKDDYTAFALKKMTIKARGGDMKEFNLWNGKAQKLQNQTTGIVGFILKECNDMIKEAEGIDWISEEVTTEEGEKYITKLKPLFDINVKDNYDIPTQLFIGSNPMQPIQRGLELRNKVHIYRNLITETMSNYKVGEKVWSFIAPTSQSGLYEALKSANPEDTAKIAHFYNSLTIPETLYDYGEEKEIPWVSATFNHAPIVAAAAMFTSLKVDIKNAESIASEFMLSKINEPMFVINKIEPMAMAQSGYINRGDSLDLRVLIAAYDSTELNVIRWGMDEDTLPERWTEATGNINLAGIKSGEHRVKGVIGVRERNQIAWKPWSFDYNVGEPMGVISQPGQRILYRGYDNEIAATASGYPSDKVSISVSSGCHISRSNGNWIVKVDRGVRNATISVNAEKENGEIVRVASNNFEVKPMPNPKIFLGGIKNGQNPSCSSVRAQSRISIRYDETVSLTGVQFRILGGVVRVGGKLKTGKIKPDGSLDANAKSILAQSCGEMVTITCKYSDPSGTVQNAIPLSIKVK